MKVAIIIPCYNEADRLDANNSTEYLLQNAHVHFYFIDDGSTDNTISIINGIMSKFNSHVTLLKNESNKGKAESVRLGVIESFSMNPDFIGYLDADLAAPLTEIRRFIHKFKSNNELKAVCGSRILRLGSSIRRSVFRHYFGRIFATIVSNILNIPVYDTQCGAKIFLAEFAEFIFSEKFLSRWFFDVELFARSIEHVGRQNTVNGVLELPLSQWHDKGQSKVTWANVLQTPLELLRIYIFYRNRIAKA